MTLDYKNAICLTALMEKVVSVKCLVGIICVALITCVVSLAGADGEVGRVKKIEGTGSIFRAAREIPVKIDEMIFTGDRIKTGSDGYLGVTFKDNGLLAMGPNGEIVIDEFLFSPAQEQLSFAVRIMKGAAAYLSGVIAKLSPRSVRFETPEATIAIRGTRFLIKVDEP